MNSTTIVEGLACGTDIAVAFGLVSKPLRAVVRAVLSVDTVAGSHIRSDAPIRQPLQELSVPVRRVGRHRFWYSCNCSSSGETFHWGQSGRNESCRVQNSASTFLLRVGLDGATKFRPQRMPPTTEPGWRNARDFSVSGISKIGCGTGFAIGVWWRRFIRFSTRTATSSSPMTHATSALRAKSKLSKTDAHAAIADAAASRDRPAALADYASRKSDRSLKEGDSGPTVPKRETISALSHCPSRPTRC
jgi:hypothetical protein